MRRHGVPISEAIGLAIALAVLVWAINAVGLTGFIAGLGDAGGNGARRLSTSIFDSGRQASPPPATRVVYVQVPRPPATTAPPKGQ